MKQVISNQPSVALESAPLELTPLDSTSLKSKTFNLSATVQIIAAVFVGLALLYVVGFSPMEMLHNAAHDSRHSFVFPCH